MKEKQTHSITLESTCKITDEICLPNTKLPRVVIVGGGFAGLALVEKLKHKEVQVVLLDKNNFHQFQPLLYQVATSALEPDSIVFPFRKQINGYKNVFFRLAEVEEIQPETFPDVSIHPKPSNCIGKSNKTTTRKESARTQIR